MAKAGSASGAGRRPRKGSGREKRKPAPMRSAPVLAAPTQSAPAQPATPFRIAYVRGVTPAKWVRIWEERMRRVPIELIRTDRPNQESVVRGGLADMGFVRLPIDHDGLHAIPLYEERQVVVVPKDHVLAAAEAVTGAEVAQLGAPEHPFDEHVDDTLALVAAGVGSVVLPQSVARLHARRDLVAREVTDAAPTRIALAWPSDPDPARTDWLQYRIDTFIGIVRGRTANSSRD